MLRRRIVNMLRQAALAVTVASYALSASVSMTSMVYCIGGADGHSGFELVAGTSTDCGSCCNEDGNSTALTAGGHCTDVVVVVSQDRTTGDDPTPAFAEGLSLPVPGNIPAHGLRADTAVAAAPPRSASEPELRSTVVLTV